jgi:integrase
MAYIQERTAADGTTSYRVQVRLKGYPTETATFARKTDAKKWGQNTEAAIREGRHFKTTEAKKHTVAELIDRYVRDVLPVRAKDAAKRTRQLIWWKEQMGVYALADVTPALIVEYRYKLANGLTPAGTKRGPATVVRYLAAFSHALNTAVKEWGWLDDSPMRKVSKPREPRGRVRFLDDNERGRLLDAAKESGEPNLYPMVVLALATGMRQGEALNLTWADVDFERGRVVLHETKNGERRSPPLARAAAEVLREHAKIRRLDTQLVFPSARAHKAIFPRAAWERAIAAAEIADFKFHDLRHTAASYLAMAGATQVELAAVLGHKTLQMVLRYSHLSEAHTRGVVDRMNEKIFGGGT